MNHKKFKIIAAALLLLLLPTIAIAHGIPEADKQAIIEGGNFAYFKIGAIHMLTGYDHLLFIFGIIFFLKGFRDIVVFITVFTVGHSIPLVFATLYGVSANPYIIDAVIAMSVAYKGLENLDFFRKYLQRPSPNLLIMVFSFGVIHGFGLSTRLQQLPLPEEGLILRILSFNVGVEVGQIIALAIMLPFVSAWRKFGSGSFAQFSFIANTGLVLAGLLLFIFQIHGYLHTTYPDAFGFSIDNHYHAHEHMGQEVLNQQENVRQTIY